MKSDVREAVATGNWGCGAFKGDACLKSLLQLMAAGVAGRDVAYFTFGNNELRDQVADIHGFLSQHQVSVGRLWQIMTSYSPSQHRYSLYDHIYKAVNSSTIPSLVNFRVLFTPKKPKIEEKSKDDQTGKPVQHSNGQILGVEEIEQELESVKDLMQDEGVEEEGVKPIEARTLSVQNDKELCLKRLSSSWNNLNESKKDFDPSECARTSDHSSEAIQAVDHCKQNITKKKKISDYFQPASKS